MAKKRQSKAGMAYLSIALPDDLLKRLEKEAVKDDRSVSSFARRILAEEMERRADA